MSLKCDAGTTYMMQSRGIEAPNGAGTDKNDVDRSAHVSLTTSPCKKPLRKPPYLSGSAPGF
jgi:hypothetical protein